MNDSLKIYDPYPQVKSTTADTASLTCRDFPVRSASPERSQTPETMALDEFNIVVSPYFRWKQIFDILAAALMLIPALPLIGLIVILVRLTSRGPGIYRQVRVGKNGRIFTMFKIRSMRQDAEVGRGAVWSQDNDPRITRLGQILRKLHLDELPQLYNVLRGEMSLVGPRPERPEFVTVLATKIDGYCDRLAVEPGITGLAQINLPPDTDLNSVRRKLFLDREYVQSAGWLFDLRILLCTAGRVLKISQPILLRALGLHREIPSLATTPATHKHRPDEQTEVREKRSAA